ncbi:MAG: tetratricopeptide repeat protein, partial [Candidatus Zixiibacteriota bacterium]
KAAMRELVELQPQNRWAQSTLLQLLKQSGEWDEAYNTAAALVKLDAGTSKKPLAVFKYHQANELYRKKEYHKARIVFKEALGLDPTLAPAYLAIGDSYYEEDRFEDAVNFWSKLIETVPDQGHRVIDRLKKTLFDLGRFGEIAEICERILKYSPKNLEARLTLAEFHEKKDDLDTALEILTQVVEDTPGNLPAVMALVRLYLERGEHGQIENLFRMLERHHEKLQGTSPETRADVEPISIP